MLGGQGGCDPLPGLLAALAAAAHLGKEHVHHKQLGHPGGDRTQLKGALVGAALKDNISKGSGGRLGKVGDQNDPGLLFPDHGENVHQLPGGAGVGEEQHCVPLGQCSGGDGLKVGVVHGNEIGEGGGKQLQKWQL